MRERGSIPGYWLPVLIWMGLIFIGSTDLLSAPHTSRFLGPALRWLLPGWSEAALDTAHAVLRKCGHLSEYAVLVALLWRARRKPVRDELRPWSWPEARWAISVATVYAASDEFHQSFVPTRGASVGDVLIDMAGAMLGIMLIWRIGSWRKQW